MNNTPQTRIGIVYKTDFGKDSAEFPVLEVLVQCLNLEIFYKLVYDESLAYNANVFQNSYRDDGAIVIDVICSSDKKDYVINLINEFVLKIIIDEKKFNLGKNSLVGSVVIDGETIARKVQIIAENYLFKNMTETNDDYVEKLKSVKIKEVLELYQKFISEQKPEVITLDLD